uniref:Palmitoyltransferase n=1 Tax=Takifugu rubripes TaxID=31033 RepID=H2UT64_TAKRU
MDWSGDDNGHDCHHGHGGHSHSHGSRPAQALMANFHGKGADQAMSLSQQPNKRPLMDDSSSWDIVKASQFGILERCKELVEAGYDVRQPDKENVTLLHWAAINNRSELVKYYISKGAIVDQLGGDLSSTPLHWAIRQGHLSMVIQLLRYGADPSIGDGEGYHALHLAILFQHMAIAAYLMAKGQDVDEPDANGQTPVMLAAQKIIGPEPTKFLIKNNASLSAVDKVNRNTPLHCAVLAGNVDAAHILLEAGASVDAENLSVSLRTGHRRAFIPARESLLTRQRPVCIPQVFLQFLLCTALFGGVGAIVDMNSESWLLKGILLFPTSNLSQPFPPAAIRYAPFCPQIKKPIRTQHCFSCDACVAKQDHHSIWTNGCIGARNHHYYVLFLLSLTLMGSWMFYCCLTYWAKHCVLHYADQGLWAAVSALVDCSPWLLCIFFLAFYHTCWSASILLVQLYQIAFLGLTSAERTTLTFQQRKLNQSVSLRQNPYNLGVVRNLVSFFQLRCCGLFKPAIIDWTQQNNKKNKYKTDKAMSQMRR